ncbi:MAG: hypothetical protein Q9163_005264 [Psora crenata]
MSMLNWGIGDVLAITKFAWDLYHNCYLVAREAPDDFRQLVNELASLQGVLRTLRDDINSDKSFFERLGEHRKQTLERCLQSCFDTLRKLQKLTVKYRELGAGDGIQFWRRLKWSTKQGEITDLKSKIMVHTCNISLCMSSIGNSSLARIELSMMKALEKQEATSSDVQMRGLGEEDGVDGLNSLTKAKDADAQGIQGLQRAFTDTTLNDHSQISPASTPSISEGDSQDFSSPDLRRKDVSPVMGKVRKDSSLSMHKTSWPSLLPPPSPRASSDGYMDDAIKPQHDTLKKSRTKRLMSGPIEPMVKSNGHGLGSKDPEVQVVVAQAMQELAKIRQKEQSARPLRVVRQDPVHQPNDALKARFEQLAEDELKIRRLNARDWLRVATWWLLKARFNTRVEEEPRYLKARGSFSVSSEGKSGINQAYVDLLKASWILYTIILRDDHISVLMTDENRKLFYNLSDGISEDLSDFQAVDAPERDTLLAQNYNIWELLQPEEETYDDDDLLPGLENGRWITVEQDDAGEEDEKVLFRTFVDAAIGSKKYRMRSKGAPYMILLSTKVGESEPKVTLCNQSGTLCLTRDFTIEDLRDQPVSINASAGSNISPPEAIPLSFGSMNIAVAFANEEDLQSFMYIPRAYFEAVSRREPLQLARATETLLFRRSVEVFEQLQTSTMKPMSARRQYQSCDLRILETTCKEAWRTTRRLVISSSAGEKKPWCTEFFLPLSRVQIQRQGIARQCAIKWSDCAHEQSDKTDGNYNKIYSYIYDDSNPNIALSLFFRNSQDATDFERTVLQLSLSPIFDSASGSNARYIYIVADTEPHPKNYKALMLTHTRLDWKYSELFYMYRDMDFQYDHSSLRVRFPQVYYTDYISTHVDKLYKPPVDDPPHFSHCEKRVGNAPIDFDDESTAMQFMSSLTSGYTLIFSRRAHYVTTKPTSRFGSSKSNKGTAEVQLWTKGNNNVRLISRWDDKVQDKWLTTTVPRDRLDHKRASNRASLPKVEYDRGRKIDMANLVARDPRDKKEAQRRVGPITIAFESFRDQEEFAAALEGKVLPAGGMRRSTLDDLMDMC